MKQDTRTSELVALTWIHAPSKYNGSELVVLLKLAGLTSSRPDGDFRAFPGIDSLARMCGLKSQRGIQKIIKTLKKDGVLKVKYRRGHGSWFYVLSDAIAALPVADPREETAITPDAAELANTISEKLDKADSDQTWPRAVQNVFDRGHNKSTWIQVWNHGCKGQWRAALHETGADALDKLFSTIHADMTKGGTQ